MPEIGICLEFQSNRSSAASYSPLGHPQDVMQYGATYDATADSWGELPQPVIPRSAHDNTASTGVIGRGPIGINEIIADVAGGTATARVHLVGNNLGGTIDGPFAATSTIAVVPSTDVGWGRASPIYQAILTGDLATALETAIGTPNANTMACIRYAYPAINGYLGLLHAFEFKNDPPDDRDTATEVFTRIWEEIRSAGYRRELGIDYGGSNIVINDCQWSAVAPEGRVYIRPEDIGSGVGQIPAAVGDNLAANFRFHPSVFIRRKEYFNGMSIRYTDGIALDTEQAGSQPIGIVVVEEAPVSSTWLATIDSCPVVFVLLHPTGSDYRRPRDIYNNVLVPILSDASGAQLAPANMAWFGGLQSGSNTNHSQLLSRLRFAEYFRCLGLAGTTTTQTDTSPA